MHEYLFAPSKFCTVLQPPIGDRTRRAQSAEVIVYIKFLIREDSGGLWPPSFSLLRRAGRALRALMGTFDPILSNSLCKFVQIGMQFCAGRDAILCRSGRNFVRIGTQICADWDAILCGSGRKFVQIGTQFCAGSTNRNAAAGHPPPADQSQAFKSYKMRLG